MVPAKSHESWAIAQLEPRPPADEIEERLQQIAQHITDNLGLDVIRYAESAFGLGLFCMFDQVARDRRVRHHALPSGDGRVLSFAKHDEGDNFRTTTYTREGWLMLLNLPMDYRNDDFLHEAISKFGKLRTWFREDLSPTRTLVKCLYDGAWDIPRSLVVREANRRGGTVVSWYVPIFILASEHADVLPGDESPEL